MESVPKERIPQTPSFLRTLRLKDRRQDAGGMRVGKPIRWIGFP